MSQTESNLGQSTGGGRQWVMLAVMFVVLVIAMQLAKQWLNQSDSVEFVTSADCDLTQGCAARDSQRQIQLRFNRQPHSAQPFTAQVNLSQVNAHSVTLELQGVEMFMGINRYPLTRGDDDGYHATLQLPACTTGKMQWRARVLLDNTEHADFTFWAE